jgi:6-phosphogluconate dehydrogenase (decarboxylating)
LPLGVLAGPDSGVGGDSVVSIAAAVTWTAEHGDLTFMIGGHPRATDAVTPLLKQMGKDVIYCGKHGAGAALTLWAHAGLCVSLCRALVCMHDSLFSSAV